MNWKIFYETKKGSYEVSDEGQIRNTKTNYTYNLSKNTIGYYTVKINKKWFLVHRLVAKYFIGEIEDKIVHHKNNINTDNNINNLEITTQSQNILYSVIAGNHKGYKNLKGQNQYTKAKRLGLPKPITKNQYYDRRIIKRKTTINS